MIRTSYIRVLVTIAAACGLSQAADITMLNGTVLKSARIVAIAGESVDVVYEEGLRSFSASQFSVVDLYEAKNRIDKEQAEKQKRIEEAGVKELAELEARRRENAEVVQDAKNFEYNIERELKEVQHAMELSVVQVVEDGVICSATYAHVGPTKYLSIPKSAMVKGTGLHAHKMVEKNWTETVPFRNKINLPDLIFVYTNTASLYEGKKIFLLAWPAGTYSYTSVRNAERTLRAFTTSSEDYLRRKYPYEPGKNQKKKAAAL